MVAVSPGAVNTFATNLPPAPPLWLNEVQPENLTGPADALGHRGPWLELVNAGTNPVSLAGLYLSDSYTNLGRWAFPAGAVIQPGEFKVIFADGVTAESTLAELHTSFSLPAGSGAVALSRLQNGRPAVLDYLTYTQLLPNRSYGAVPDAQPFNRQVMFFATPGRTNNAAAQPVVVYINEWMAANTLTLANPATGKFDDWIELFNPGPDAVDLGGCWLTDTLTNLLQFQVPNNQHYVIPPTGFLLVWADGKPNHNSTNEPELHVNFQLSKSGEAIGLSAPDGTVLDSVVFGAQVDDVSEGHYPDGVGPVRFLTIPTPRLPNRLPEVPAPQINPALVLSGGQVQFTFDTIPTLHYQIEYTDTLNPPLWQPLGPPVLAAGLSMTTTDTITNAPQRFYRVSAGQP